MKLTVEAVSRYGFKADGQWFNKQKGHDVSFEGLKRGDELEVEVENDKYVTSLEKLSSGVVDMPSRQNTSGSSEPSEKDAQIARSTAVKAVLGSPLDLLNGLSESELNELIRSMSNFILTGKIEVPALRND